MKVTTLGIDVAKTIFQLHGVDARGNVAVQQRVTRGKLWETVAQLPPCLIGMESCASAQY
jgi:transposase